MKSEIASQLPLPTSFIHFRTSSSYCLVRTRKICSRANIMFRPDAADPHHGHRGCATLSLAITVVKSNIAEAPNSSPSCTRRICKAFTQGLERGNDACLYGLIIQHRKENGGGVEPSYSGENSPTSILNPRSSITILSILYTHEDGHP